MFSPKIAMLLLLLLISVDSYSQLNKDTVTVLNCPVRKGYAKFFDNYQINLADRGIGISIYSKENDVFAVKTGIVKSVFAVDDLDHILVKSGDTFIVYGNLDKPLKKVGDTIQINEFVGKLKQAGGEDNYELFFVIMVGRKEIRDEDYIAFFKRFK